MSHKPTTVADLDEFTVLIDARSPAEYALDHIPGAINCPVLDDEERRIVGTIYVQQSAFEARKIGGAFVARNIARHLDELFRDKSKDWRPLVYCWRGGMRSGSFVNWLRLVGWDAQQLKGGYKAWRAHVIEQIAQRAPALDLRVLCGPTGSAKTRVLQALAEQGEQVLDLEDLAAHRGSVLGAVPGRPQPSQKGFETQLMHRLGGLDPTRRVWVEAESRRIGRISVPEPLLQRLRESPVVEIAASPTARLAYLLRDYAWLGDDRQALADKLGSLRELLPKEVLAQWQAWALDGALTPLFEALMARHYDPLYARSQGRHLARLPNAQRVECEDLSDTGIQHLAARIAQLP
ncbi:tRNA 2-selenouridine(34) synthase MnmH [Roseateles asaccharophilus]|uniref:tRNA 2-selenouridine synthase n=1 Tax=Roseateles asaccharophilus TaxID=582607 RepID=A0ABU2ADN5_9BURK|nr:tRNA 2-selenouridine(34) synthase MnmH [Roseateles asaccharophilus]MDR7335316.1 tRNA 2-selenouridine synthase [Roseateles asaccharophilus]